jgi:ganglioside GM2 activator
MEKKIGGFYVKIPCIDNFGSCNYGSLCEQWADACPKHFEKYGIPCTCPIPANTYSVSDVIVQINGKLPSVGDGTYRITGDAASAAGHLGCLKLEITLKGA